MIFFSTTSSYNFILSRTLDLCFFFYFKLASNRVTIKVKLYTFLTELVEQNFIKFKDTFGRFLKISKTERDDCSKGGMTTLYK